MALFRQAMAVAWLFAAAVYNHVDVASAQQLSASDVCNNGLPASQGCMRVNNDWNTFRSSINAAVQGDAIRYCPFLITNVNGLPATPTVRAAFACSVPGACVIRGSGRHILVQDANSDNLFYGFVFQNATDTAIRVAANATKTVLVCHSFFQGNSALHGGAIRTDPTSNVYVQKCIFMKNNARVGGAISNHGNMTVVQSTFELNNAIGGAIEINGSATLKVTSSSFNDNSASNGAVLYFNGPDNQIAKIYKDGGGNKATGSNCKGLFHIGNPTGCIVFKGTAVAPTPVAAPTKTPTAPIPTKPTTATKPHLPPIVHANATYTPPIDPATNALPLVSRNEPVGYYNFNVDDPKFGPSAWSNVDVTNNPYSMYANLNWDTTKNECGTGGFQSPIDLYITTALCLERHQIRAHNGNWKNLTRDGEIVFEVTPTRLRVQIKGNGSSHPIVDASHGYDPIFANHIELTIPSLHTFNGKRYDAEMSVYSVYSKLQEVLIVSVVIDASKNIFNLQFQKMLSAWQKVTQCGIGKGRRLLQREIPEGVEGEDRGRFNRVLDEETERMLAQTAQIDGQFDIFDVTLFPSIYFYGYKGSLVVPPCTKSAEWRVLDKQMQISWAQLQQLKRILKRGPCESSPLRNGLNDVLSRPLQYAGPMDAVWHCTKANYLSDCQRFGLLCPAPGYTGKPGAGK